MAITTAAPEADGPGRLVLAVVAAVGLPAAEEVAVSASLSAAEEVSVAAAPARAGKANAHQRISRQTRARPDRRRNPRSGVENFRSDSGFHSARRTRCRSIDRFAGKTSSALAS